MALPETQFESSGHTVKFYGLHEGEYIFKLIKHDQQFYEFDLLDLVRRLPIGEGSVVDVGANLGNHTVFFSLIMGRRTHAFEISEKNLAVLRENVQANGLADLVTIHEFGLSSQNTMCSVVENYENMGQTHVAALEADAAGGVELRRLDDVMAPDDPVAIMKVDVEGSELDVLMGAQATLERDRPVCLIEGHPGPGFEAVAFFFAERGYRPVQILGRSDNWVFVHSDKIAFLLPYIEVNAARSQTRALASNDSRLRTIQGNLDHLKPELSTLIERSSASMQLKIDELTSKADRRAAQLDEIATELNEGFTSVAAAADLAVKELTARQKAASTASKVQNKKLADMLQAHLESVTRRPFKRWAKDGIKAVARGLAKNKVSHRLILLTVPKSIRTRAADKLLGRRRRTVPAIPATVDLQLEQPPSNPLSDSASYNSALICPAYPGGQRIYGGEFVRTRVNEYAARGHSVLILENSPRNSEPILEHVEGVDILRILPAHLGFFVDFLASRVDSFMTHSPSPETVACLNERIASERQFHWFHGFDIRDYRRLYFNYSTGERAALKPQLDALNQTRVSVIGPCISDVRSTKIFVSDFLKSIAERDMGQPANNSHVIPNFVDGERFEFSEKTPEQSRRMLLIRAFSARNYANDIAIEAISLLRDRPGFEDIQFTIRGFGDLFHITDQIADLPNVDVIEGHLAPAEIVALHATHGVFLCPSRFDTQGVSMGEAMASGLVCITNPVTAIPEYTDPECSILVRPNDPVAYANAIWDMYQHPEQLPEMSRRAAERVRRQCGIEQTIEKELAVLAARTVAAPGSAAGV